MKRLLLVAMFVVSSLVSNASTKFFTDQFTRNLAYNFQEKLYVQTDRDSYTTGETIWFRVHRADATYHNPYLYSGLVYVDLYDYDDNVIRKMMLSPVDSVFSGTFKVPGNIPHGSCYMVAYTNWQQNYDPDFYYRRKIFINNPQNKKVRVTSEFHKESRDRLRADFQISSVQDYEWEDNEYLLDVTLITDDTIKPYRVITRSVTAEGKVSVNIPLEDSVKYLSVKFNDDLPESFSQRFVVPYIEDEIDMQFMPEGGALIAGMKQRVAFKAISVDGLGAAVNGTLYNSAGQMVGFIGAVHLGMGDFMMTPQAGESYYVEINREDGTKKRFDLPEVQPAGVMLACTSGADAMTVAVLASPSVPWEGKHLIIQCRGRLLQVLPLSRNVAFNLSNKSLPNGIIQCAVVDSLGTVYSQRLLFNNREDSPVVNVSNLEPSYSKRDLVNLNLAFTDAAGAPVKGSFAASVVDDSRAIIDTMAANLRSYLLLSSDIKGNVEYPNYYFDKNIAVSRRIRNLDLLMMTQGWKRFELNDLLLGTKRDYDYSIQLGQSISGRIKSLWSDEGQMGTLAIVSSAARIFKLVSADSTGHFELSGLRFPNGTKFVVQGMNEKNKKGVEVVLENEGFRKIQNPIIDARYLLREDAEIVESTNKFDEFYRDLSLDYYYENGIKVYIMDEIAITAEEEPEDYLGDMYKELSEDRISGEDLNGGAYTSIWDWLAELPGVYVDETTNKIEVRGGSDVVLLVDDLPYELEDLGTIQLAEVESIGFSADQAGLSMVDGGADGTIMVRLKDGGSVGGSKPKETLSFFTISPMGYNQAEEFYVPLYDTPETLANTDFDGRVTLHWEPNLKVDEAGNSKLKFYTADFPASYLVRIEGITAKGDPLTYTMRIKNE